MDVSFLKFYMYFVCPLSVHVLLYISCSCMLPVLCRELSLRNFLHCYLFFSHRKS
jgi:hypothetical protein